MSWHCTTWPTRVLIRLWNVLTHNVSAYLCLRWEHPPSSLQAQWCADPFHLPLPRLCFLLVGCRPSPVLRLSSTPPPAPCLQHRHVTDTSQVQHSPCPLPTTQACHWHQPSSTLPLPLAYNTGMSLTPAKFNTPPAPCLQHRHVTDTSQVQHSPCPLPTTQACHWHQPSSTLTLPLAYNTGMSLTPAKFNTPLCPVSTTLNIHFD